MIPNVTQGVEKTRPVIQLTREWGDWSSVSLFLDRCRVDTPRRLVDATWAHVHLLRASVGKVVDFGAGDGRFAESQFFQTYVGYEIDDERCRGARLPSNAALLNRCAFSDEITDADLCIGNPPFVRNQDLPTGWRQYVSEVLRRRTGVSISGLANAWQYFFLLAIASSKDDGLCALVIPYEWVSRPSVRVLREYIHRHRWNVSVYRLVDSKFNNVLTTSSITVVDKGRRDDVWSYFEEAVDGNYLPLNSPTRSKAGVIQYVRKRDLPPGTPWAMRGLSPGTQSVLTLTEGERVRHGLQINRDVVPCVTSLRHLPTDAKELNEPTFRHLYREQGKKCWLVRTDKKLTTALRAYIDAVPHSKYQTATCLNRSEWWKFSMPLVPQFLIAQSFRGEFPKGVRNEVYARAVGGVCGIYDINEIQISRLTGELRGTDLGSRVVAYSNGFKKIEINQLNSFLQQEFGHWDGDE